MMSAASGVDTAVAIDSDSDSNVATTIKYSGSDNDPDFVAEMQAVLFAQAKSRAADLNPAPAAGAVASGSGITAPVDNTMASDDLEITVKKLRAQVAQHDAWSKERTAVARRTRRNLSRVFAVLEGASKDLAEISNDIDMVSDHYTFHMTT